MISVKRGDTRQIAFTVNADLTNCTTRLLARPTYEQTPSVPLVLAHSIGVVTESTSTVYHQLTGTLEGGSYFVELEIARAGGEVVSAPTDGYFLLIVEPDVA